MALAFGLMGSSFALVLDDAILRGYQQGLTQYRSSSQFRPYDTLRRDEAAKFFVKFAEGQGQKAKSQESCRYTDERAMIPDLRSYVVDACRYQIIKGAQGKYFPADQLSNAQAVTIIVRILAGAQAETRVAHWSDNYYAKAKELWLDLSNFHVKDNPTTRGNVMMLMHAAAQLKHTQVWEKSGDREVDRILQSLTDILDEK